MSGRLENSLEIAAGFASFLSSSLSAFLQCFTWSPLSVRGGGSTSGSRGSNPAGGSGRRDGAEDAAHRRPPPPPPPPGRSGEFPVASVPRRRLEAWMDGGEGELGGGETGGVVGVAVAEQVVVEYK
uniref:Uncharacterized protein n=1 Tax=Arundo donax TaxID=35708 RepID=A0A0A9CJ39_ARUDO